MGGRAVLVKSLRCAGGKPNMVDLYIVYCKEKGGKERRRSLAKRLKFGTFHLSV